MVRTRGEPLHVLSKILRIRNRPESSFQFDLRFRIRRRKPVEVRGIIGKGSRRKPQRDGKAGDRRRKIPMKGTIKVFHISLTSLAIDEPHSCVRSWGARPSRSHSSASRRRNRLIIVNCNNECGQSAAAFVISHHGGMVILLQEFHSRSHPARLILILILISSRFQNRLRLELRLRLGKESISLSLAAVFSHIQPKGPC
jgi:hypothetical protein